MVTALLLLNTLKRLNKLYKMRNIFQDDKYYEKLNKNPLPHLIKLTKNLLLSWGSKGGIFEYSPYFKLLVILITSLYLGRID